MENFYSRCLLCTCTPDVTPHLNIFSEAGSQLQLSEKINKYLNIQIVSELPQNVCHSCMEKLEVTHELVTSSQQARSLLLQIKQHCEVIKQEISDCLTKDLDFNQPAIEDGNYVDTTTNEMPVYNLDSTQSASEDFVQSGNNVVLPIEESTDITESTKNSAILKMLELKQCHFCQSEMYSQVLELHLMLCHQIYQEPAESDLNRTLQCLVCQCQLPSDLMQDHILNQHPPKPNPKLKNQIQCHYCHMQFSYCDMPQHLECHHGPYAWTECLHCKKMVRNTQIDLEIHLFQEHSGGQFLVCLACDLMYALTGEEQAHMQTHLNYKYKCPLQSCNKIFDTFTSIRHHVLILHPGFEQQMQDELKEQTYDILHSNAVANSETCPKIRSNIQNLYGSPVECDICNKRIKHKYSLIEHKNKEHNMNLMFDCGECGLQYATYKRLTEHFRYKHTTKDYECGTCRISFTKKGYSAHLDWHRRNPYAIQPSKTERRYPYYSVICGICKNLLKNRTALLAHINSKHLDVVGKHPPFTFETFNKDFDNNGTLINHSKLEHLLKLKSSKVITHFKTNQQSKLRNEQQEFSASEPLSTVSCSLCNFRTKNKNYLLRHMNSKHLSVIGEPLPFSCEICDKTFISYNSFLWHGRYEHEPKKRCKHCGKMINKSKMSDHMFELHGESGTQRRYLSDKPLPPVLCDICNFQATDKFSLVRHINNLHLDVVGEPLSFSCDLCDKEFARHINLWNHRNRVHVRRQKCPECGKSVSWYKMSNHLKTHESSGTMRHSSLSKKPKAHVPYTLCNRIASDKFSLLKHMNTEHVGDPLPECSEVSKRQLVTFSSLIEMDHQRNVHIAKIKCKHCSEWISEDRMKKNLSGLHGNQRYLSDIIPLHPVCCVLCGHIASNKFSLLKHMNNDHRDVVEEPVPFCCNVCNKQFALYKSFMDHRRMHVPKLQCKHCSKMIREDKMEKHIVDFHTKQIYLSDISLHPVCCGICNQNAVNKFSLINHFNSKHLNVFGEPLLFCCELCDKEFYNYNNLMMHLKKVHVPKKKCDQCDKMITWYNMADHVKTHERDSGTSSIGVEGYNTTMIDGLEEMLIPEIEIVEHPIKLEPAEEEQVDFLPEPQSADVKPAPIMEYKLPECQVVLSKLLVCATCCFYTDNTKEFATHLQAHQHKTYYDVK